MFRIDLSGSPGIPHLLTVQQEEAARIPFLIRYPAGISGGKSDMCINTPDIMPTLLGLAGLGDKIPAEVEGLDLSPVLRGGKGTEPPAAFMQGLGHTYRWLDGYEWRAIRDKRFTYAAYLRDGKELLFDRKADPLCMINAAEDPKYAGELSRLQMLMKKKMPRAFWGKGKVMGRWWRRKIWEHYSVLMNSK